MVTVIQPAMRNLIGFVKTAFVGGVVLLVPLVILGAAVAKLGDVLGRLSQPLAALLAVDGDVVRDAALVAAALLVVAVCFGAGVLLARGSIGRRARPFHMRPVMVRFDDHAQLAFEVDRLGDGRKVVYVPSAPDARAGAVLVFDSHRVEPLDMSVVAAVTSLRTLGRGLGPTLRPPGGMAH
jgi:uncharacterized membrane protein